MGQSPDSKSYNEAKEGIPFFQGNADFGERYPITRVWCNAPTKIAQKDDILISVRAPIGALNYAKETCCIGRGLAAITPNKTKVSTEFIFWLLKGKNNELNSLGTGSTFKAISKKVLEETKVPDISLEKQTAYSNILEKLYFIITHRRTQLEKLDLLVKARFVEMFGDPFDTTKWTVKKLKDVSVSMIDGSNIDTKYYEVNGDVLFLRIQNVWKNEFKLDDSVYISQEINEKYYYDTSLKNGDLLITKIGRYYTRDSSLGRVSVYRGKDNSANYSNNIMCVRLSNSMNSEFTNILLNLDDYQSFIKRTSKGGTDKRALSKSLIGSYPIIVPPLELQTQLADFVKQVDKSKVAVQKELDKAQMLFDSLMQEYFG